jgi:hypothetical protein
VPEISDQTPRTGIQIAGESFTVPQPYAEGHVLTANEASSLNQTYAENVRNNFASKVKEANEAGTFDLAVFQGRLDDYTAEYEFGQRTGGGGRSSDPVQAEAMSITRDLVRQALSKKGLKLADVPASEISRLAKAQLAKTDDARTIQIMETARQRVASAKEITDFSLDDTDVAATEAAVEAAPAKVKKEKPATAPAA